MERGGSLLEQRRPSRRNSVMNPSSDSEAPPTTSQPSAPPSHRLFLIDAMSYIFRAYHALPRLTNKQGMATQAVYGLHNMLRKLVAAYQPEYVVAAFDLAGPTFRHESFE